jgi:hypothetical protein
MGSRRNSVFTGRRRAYRHVVFERRPAIHQMSGVPDTEIGWDDSTHSPIGFDRLIFPGRQPESDSGEIQADPNDLLEMFEIP